MLFNVFSGADVLVRTKELESIFTAINFEWEYLQQQQQTYMRVKSFFVQQATLLYEVSF